MNGADAETIRPCSSYTKLRVTPLASVLDAARPDNGSKVAEEDVPAVAVAGLGPLASTAAAFASVTSYSVTCAMSLCRSAS